jgi:two-component system response regulator PilR (NtrC family)
MKSAHNRVDNYREMGIDEKKTRTVLVVENNGEVLDLVANVVSTQGWKPVVATSLLDARARLSEGRVDAIVTDLSLDDGDGLELVREVTASAQSRIPMIVITSYGTPEIRECARQAGAIDFIEKPFRLNRFTATLSEALTGSPIITASQLH